MKKGKEKVLAGIVLKYYRLSDKNEKPEGGPSGITCAYCLLQNIVHIGSGFKDKKGKIHHICERCAVEAYRKEHGFKTLAVAEARRRRMFDVGYLFNEILVDEYMKIKGIKDSKSLGEKINDIFVRAPELYNYLFSKEEKVRIEEIEVQAEIEAELRGKIGIVDLKQFFIEVGL
ncbi:MAG: hypothetical protein WCT25_02645 [Candidatus Paceibacterota bacterium]|jgi:hypothetical protein